jgi:hypothetical protein
MKGDLPPLLRVRLGYRQIRVRAFLEKCRKSHRESNLTYPQIISKVYLGIRPRMESDPQPKEVFDLMNTVPEGRAPHRIWGGKQITHSIFSSEEL